MSFAGSELGEFAKKTLEINTNDVSVRLDVSQSRVEYPSRFEEMPTEDKNNYDGVDFPYVPDDITIDTVVHDLGMSRKEAIEYLKEQFKNSIAG